MCGIWLLLSSDNKKSKKELGLEEYQKNFNNILGRGPDYSILKKIDHDRNIMIGFHRLSINGLNSGNQPFEMETRYFKYYLICNGEIYNFRQLAREYGLTLKTESDCEVLLPLYEKMDINRLVNLLDGVFAITIIKINKESKEVTVESARDRIGVRPMFYGLSSKNKYVYICSEMKGINDISDRVHVFPPGHIMTCKIEDNLVNYHFTKYYDFKYVDRHIENSEADMFSLIRIYFEKAIKKRLLSDRPIGSLLSGGLDSSLVSALVSRISRNKIKTFSICMDGGTDKVFSEMVAKHIKSDHYNIELTKQQFLDAINEEGF